MKRSESTSCRLRTKRVELVAVFMLSLKLSPGCGKAVTKGSTKFPPGKDYTSSSLWQAYQLLFSYEIDAKLARVMN